MPIYYIGCHVYWLFKIPQIRGRLRHWPWPPHLIPLNVNLLLLGSDATFALIISPPAPHSLRPRDISSGGAHRTRTAKPLGCWKPNLTSAPPPVSKSVRKWCPSESDTAASLGGWVSKRIHVRWSFKRTGGGRGFDRPRQPLRQPLRQRGVVQNSPTATKNPHRALRAEGLDVNPGPGFRLCARRGRSMDAHRWERIHARTHAGPPTGLATPHHSDTLKAFNPVDAANGHAVSSECYWS